MAEPEPIKPIIKRVVKRFKLTPYVPMEFEEQCTIFSWAEAMAPRHQELEFLYSTLNGIRLPIGLAVKAKRAGNKSGVPDICLDVPRGEWMGLRLELKRRQDGRLSHAQERWIAFLQQQHYFVAVPEGAKHAIIIICQYLGITDCVIS